MTQPRLLISLLKTETNKLLKHLKSQVLPKLDSVYPNYPDRNLDFRNLRIDHTFSIPGSNGVGYEATDFIPEWKTLIIGTYHDRKGDLVLWDLPKRELKCIKKEIHDVGITYVRWISETNLIATCAYDKLIKLFKPVNQGTNVHLIQTLRGHSMRIRCMVYAAEYDLLISGGDEPDLKLWSTKLKKKCSHLSTNNEGLLGSYLLYLKGKRLLGVSFKSGRIKFFSLLSRNCIYEFNAESQGRYPCGLQLLYKRNQIICNTKEHIVKIWNFDELNLEIGEELSIKTEGREPNCIVPNFDQNQLLLGCLTSKLEVYDFTENKIRQIDLSPSIKEANSLVYLKGVNKLSVCDRVTGTVCILNDNIYHS